MKKERFKAYQCNVCDLCDVDDVTDKRFCRAGYWKKCGDAKGCKAAFRLIKDNGRIGVHR
jgi:hypothetical protein